jgi:4-amino-4-deoxy-L-arabinose transferase-like glycosyltransferase
MSRERVPPAVVVIPDEGASVPDKGTLVLLAGTLGALALFVGLTTYQLTLPGLHYDEAFEAVPAMQLLLGQPVMSFRGNGVLIAGCLFPLMTQDYIGAINTYAVLPFFWLLGVNLISLRLMAVAVGLLTLGLTYRLARELYGLSAAALAVLLLSADPTFVFWSRQGVFVTSVTAAIGLAAALAWLRWWRTGARRYAIAGAFLFGLGLYAKFLFLWLIAALALAGLLFGWLGRPSSRSLAPRGRRDDTGTPASAPQVQARPYITGTRPYATWGRLAVYCLAAFSLGAGPLVLYNLQTGGTLRSVGGNLTTSYYGTNNLAFLPNLLERLNQFGAVLAGSHFWYLGGTYANPLGVGVFLAALAGGLWLAIGQARAEAPARAEARRALLPFAVIGGVILASCATVSALWVTHFAILMPWPALGVAAVIDLAIRRLTSGAGIFHRGDNRPHRFRNTCEVSRALGMILVACIVGALWLGNALTDVRYHQALSTSGGLGAHSDAVEDLAGWLTAGGRQGAPVVAMDWGIAAPVTFLTRGAVTPVEAFGYDWETDADFAARLARFVGDPASIYLWRAPDEIIFNRSADFQRLYRPLGLEEDILEAFYERSGRPVLGATRLVPKGTAANPPQPAGSN